MCARTPFSEKKKSTISMISRCHKSKDREINTTKPLLVIDKVSRALNINSIDAISNPMTSGSEEKSMYIHKRKSPPYKIKVPAKIRNLSRWMKTDLDYSQFLAFISVPINFLTWV